MGTDPMAFYACAFLGSFFFAVKAYVAMPVALVAYLLSRMLTKKDPAFMRIFMRYIEEQNAFSSIPRPSDWTNRPAGWGKGLPW